MRAWVEIETRFGRLDTHKRARPKNRCRASTDTPHIHAAAMGKSRVGRVTQETEEASVAHPSVADTINIESTGPPGATLQQAATAPAAAAAAPNTAGASSTATPSSSSSAMPAVVPGPSLIVIHEGIRDVREALARVPIPDGGEEEGERRARQQEAAWADLRCG